MDSPLVKTTVLNTVMAAISNVSGQIIHCWQHNKPYSLSVAEIASFAIYVALSVPPNYFFQNWLEAKFPGYEDVAIADPKARQKAAQEKIDTGKGSSADIAASDPEIRKRVASEDSLAQETPSKPAETPQQLNLRNLAIKLAVDQTVGMVVNVSILDRPVTREFIFGDESDSIVRLLGSLWGLVSCAVNHGLKSVKNWTSSYGRWSLRDRR